MPNELRKMHQKEKAREALRVKLRKKHTLYGVFVWTEANQYPTENAVRIYKREADAKRYADLNYVLNYVVREIVAMEAYWTEFQEHE